MTFDFMNDYIVWQKRAYRSIFPKVALFPRSDVRYGLGLLLSILCDLMGDALTSNVQSLFHRCNVSKPSILYRSFQMFSWAHPFSSNSPNRNSLEIPCHVHGVEYPTFPLHSKLKKKFLSTPKCIPKDNHFVENSSFCCFSGSLTISSSKVNRYLYSISE